MANKDSHHKTMLNIALHVIESRAQFDGYGKEQYDAKDDPDGFVASILNALHQWCVVNDGNWEEELQCAQRFFEQDMAGIEFGIDLDKPVFFEDLCCPKCGHKGSFVIEVSDCVVMYGDGDFSPSDSPLEWGDFSYCRCYECDHEGEAWNFRPKTTAKEACHG